MKKFILTFLVLLNTSICQAQTMSLTDYLYSRIKAYQEFNQFPDWRLVYLYRCYEIIQERN